MSGSGDLNLPLQAKTVQLHFHSTRGHQHKEKYSYHAHILYMPSNIVSDKKQKGLDSLF